MDFVDLLLVIMIAAILLPVALLGGVMLFARRWSEGSVGWMWSVWIFCGLGIVAWFWKLYQDYLFLQNT